MFSKETYISRRQELKKLVKSGVIILFGNNNSPCNYPSNGYYPFRQEHPSSTISDSRESGSCA